MTLSLIVININAMKIKKRYLLLLAFVIIFPIFYDRYGWIWNPWAADRLAWDVPDQDLIGQSFSITVPATYKDKMESQPTSVRNLPVVNDITLDINQINENKLPSDYKRIPATEVFTIESTYWIRVNLWAKSFHNEYKIAIIKDTKNIKYTFRFFDFHNTNRPDLVKFEKLGENLAPWNFNKTEIAYEVK